MCNTVTHNYVPVFNKACVPSLGLSKLMIAYLFMLRLELRLGLRLMDLDL